MAWKTAVEKNLFDVVLSNVGERGETPHIFFFAEPRKKYTLNPISRHAVSDITPKATRTSFFMRNAALDSDSTIAIAFVLRKTTKYRILKYEKS